MNKKENINEFVQQLVDLLQKYTDWKLTLIEDDFNPEYIRGMIMGDYDLLYDHMGPEATVYSPPDPQKVH